MEAKLKKIVPVLCILPFIIGSIGYLAAGEKVTDSLYGSFALYFVNPVSDSHNTAIEIARWTSALVTTAVVLYAVRQIGNNLYWGFRCLSGDSVAVYCDSHIPIVFGETTKAIYPGRAFKGAAKSHIIMLDSDRESLEFYDENKAMLEKKKVYIGLREIEYGLIRDNGNVTFFDMNGSIARTLWKQLRVWKRERTDQSIVIYGDGVLAQTMLNYGLLLNLYSPAQHISYHLISRDSIHEIRHPKMPLANGDEILYHKKDEVFIWDIMRNADIVIVAEELPADLLQTIFINCREREVYYYSPQAGDVGEFIQMGNIHPFGRNEDIFTDENIRQGKLIEKARQLNLHYAKQYGGEKDWNKLNGFLKWSNISSADFNEVLAELIETGINRDRESLACLEHVRWCRFHYLNYWKYGEPGNGKNKDAVKRIHVCLMDYDALGEEDKEKDRQVVEAAWPSE